MTLPDSAALGQVPFGPGPFPEPQAPFDPGLALSVTRYPYFRQMVDPRLRVLSDGDLEALFEDAFGEGVTPAEYEEFFQGLARSVGSAFKDVGRFAGQVAPGMLQGAAAGSMLGPWGALGGALVGGVGSALSRQRGAARGVGQALSGAVNLAGGLRGGGGAGAALGGLTGALSGAGGRAGQLAGLLQRPELTQALGAVMGGRNPAVSLPGGRAVPASDLLGMLGRLAREAQDEAEGAVWAGSRARTWEADEAEAAFAADEDAYFEGLDDGEWEA